MRKGLGVLKCCAHWLSCNTVESTCFPKGINGRRDVGQPFKIKLGFVKTLFLERFFPLSKAKFDQNNTVHFLKQIIMFVC